MRGENHQGIISTCPGPKWKIYFFGPRDKKGKKQGTSLAENRIAEMRGLEDMQAICMPFFVRREESGDCVAPRWYSSSSDRSAQSECSKWPKSPCSNEDKKKQILAERSWSARRASSERHRTQSSLPRVFDERKVPDVSHPVLFVLQLPQHRQNSCSGVDAKKFSKSIFAHVLVLLQTVQPIALPRCCPPRSTRPLPDPHINKSEGNHGPYLAELCEMSPMRRTVTSLVWSYSACLANPVSITTPMPCM